jgi:hypothetical protein
MAVLCPSFEVAANVLRGLGIAMNEHLLQNITIRFAKFTRNVRIECNGDAVWQKPGIKILICVDGGRIRPPVLGKMSSLFFNLCVNHGG